jgi:hypothetical protein
VVSAEYAVGTVAASAVAATLLRLGADGWFSDQLWEIIRAALRPGVLLELLRGRLW